MAKKSPKRKKKTLKGLAVFGLSTLQCLLSHLALVKRSEGSNYNVVEMDHTFKFNSSGYDILTFNIFGCASMLNGTFFTSDKKLF